MPFPPRGISACPPHPAEPKELSLTKIKLTICTPHARSTQFNKTQPPSHQACTAVFACRGKAPAVGREFDRTNPQTYEKKTSRCADPRRSPHPHPCSRRRSRPVAAADL